MVMKDLVRALFAMACLVLAPGFGCQRHQQEHSDTVAEIARNGDVARPADLHDLSDVVHKADVATATDAAEILAPDEVLDSTGGDADSAPGVLFSFAILADPHLDGNPTHRENLRLAVERLIAERTAYSIELVFVLGDIAWGTTGELSNLADAKEILDQLEGAGMRYLPVLGDNEVQAGNDQEFHQVFSPHYQYLADLLDEWQQMPTPQDGLYLENFSFDHRGVHFVSADFISRQPGNEAAELHDFAGGSWPWFQADIKAAAQQPAERINIFTHHGMFRTGFEGVDKYLFSKESLDQVVDFLCPYRHHVAASYGGHIHQNWYWEVSCKSGELIYEVWSTDDGFDEIVPPEADDDRITIRVVGVSNGPGGFLYEQQIIEEPVSSP
jgi:hypothetical protein